MDDDQVDDLKQFMASLVSRQTSTIREEVVSDLRKEINALDIKLTAQIDNLSLAVGERWTRAMRSRGSN